MEKRGRKPKERKGYFYEKEEHAIVQYIKSTDENEKNKIFNEILLPALTKMIESIIRRYKLFVPDEEFEQNFNDTISYLLTKIRHYKPVINEYEEIEKEKVRRKNRFVPMYDLDFDEKKKEVSDDDPEFVKVTYLGDDDTETEKYYKRVKKKYKAYSYCGTVCRNYLMYKCAQYAKKRKRNTSYDTMFEELNNSAKYSFVENDDPKFSERLVAGICEEIEEMINNPDEYNLDDEEVTVGKALINLFRNWEDVLPSGSNKLLKSTILYFLREETMMSTKEIRENMSAFKKAYYLLKKKAIK